MAGRKVNEHLFVWQIENFSACCNRRKFSLISPTMRAMNLDDTLWKIELFTVSKMGKNYLVYLQRASEDDGPDYLNLEYEFYLIDVFGNKILQERELLPKFANESKVAVKINREWLHERKKFLLPNDTLTLECHVSKHSDRYRKAHRSVVQTTIDVERFSFVWTIRGLSPKASAIKRVVHVKCKMLSEGFVLACEYVDSFDEQQQQKTPEGGSSLRLVIMPKKGADARTFMSVTIRALGGPRGKIEADHIFEDGTNDAWHLPSFDLSDMVESLQEDDRLDLACEFAISDGLDDTQTEETSVLPAEPSWEGSTLQHQIRSIYESCVNCDILVETDGRSESFRAHKMILSARSLLLRRVLDDCYVRKRLCRSAFDSKFPTGFYTRSFEVVKHGCRLFISKFRGVDSVFISGLHVEVVEQMLQCMYTDDLDPRCLSNAQDLYEAGVTFEFKLLQEKSLNYLRSHLNTKEIYSTLIFADTHGCFQLKCDCLDFILKNNDNLLASREWLRFRTDHERLSNQVLDALQTEVEFCPMDLTFGSDSN